MKREIKRNLQRIIIFLIKSLRKVEVYLNGRDLKEGESGYVDLTPRDDIDEDNNYTEILDWALQNKKVRNIALTGPYGSGKSSILQSYKMKRKEYNYLNISLASFESDEEDILPNMDKVERDILQQMFYQVKGNKIPYSRFKRIKNLTYRNIIMKLVVFFLMIASGIYIFKPNFIIYIQNNLLSLEKSNLNVINNEILLGIFIITLITSISYLSKYIYSNLTLSKIKLGKGEVELGKGAKDSIFNEHLDEMLYFFQVTKFNIVIIEDLDRFKDINIFVKLRELNTLLNNSNQIDRKIVFIYAVKDNLFSKDSRTKFFDFIIPAIPVVNSFNSKEVLEHRFKECGLEESLSPKLISDITMYIDDMRILLNITNEFIMYKKKLGKIPLGLNHLLAIIVYKNIYPSDFADLQANKGMVYEVFQNKNKLIETKVKDIEEKYQEITEKIDLINNEYLIDIEELKSVFLFKLRSKLNHDTIKIDGANKNIYNLIQDDEFENLINSKGITDYYHRFNTTFSGIENELNLNMGFKERKKLILEKKENESEKLKSELEKLEHKKSTIRLLSLNQIIDKNNYNIAFNDTIKKNKLLVYLIREGYIDEMYEHYITYFYPGSLSVEDINFVLSIKNQQALDFNFKLVNREQIMSKLHSDEFNKEEILNYDLVQFILSYSEKYGVYFQLLLSQLKNESDKSIAFIKSFMEITEHKEYFVRMLCKQWINIWKFIEYESNFTKDKKDEYLKYIIKFADIEDIFRMNKKSILTKYISNHVNFVGLFSDKSYFDKVKEVIKKLKVKFKYIDKKYKNTELFGYIYKNNFYQVNEQIIEVIIGIEDQDVIEKLKLANYSTIKMSNKIELVKYIEDNIDHYISNVFLRLRDNNYESEETIIDLLNNKKISEDNKGKILRKEKNRISNINKIDRKVWSIAINNNKITANWFNVVKYYEEVGELDKSIVNYLNREDNCTQLSNDLINTQNGFNSETIDGFIEELIRNKEISSESFENLAKSIAYEYQEFDTEGLSVDKVDTMIENKILCLSQYNYDNLKENFTIKHIQLIEKNINKFIDNQIEYNLSTDDMDKLLNYEIITIDDKIRLINNISEDFGLSNTLVETMNRILQVAKSKIALKVEVVSNILEYDLPKEDKIDILLNNFDTLSEDNLTELLSKLGGSYVKLAQKGPRPTFRNNDINKRLINALDSKRYISSWKVEYDKIKVNTKKK